MDPAQLTSPPALPQTAARVRRHRRRTPRAQRGSRHDLGRVNANQSGNFEDQYLDDTGWWALAYDITGDAAYLQRAETDANYIHSYWDSTCGGGIWWSTAKTYKNAIENELFLKLAAELHNRIPGDTTYLGRANSEWSWFSASGLINGSHLADDGLTSSCQISSTTNWTYIQGVILAGLSALYQATGNTALLTTAESIANAATSALTVNGVLVEPSEPNCGADGPSFKGIFVRDLRAFATIAGTAVYNTFFQEQAASIEADDTNSAGQIGLVWAGPIQGLTPSATASGAEALVAALPQPGVSSVTGAVTSGMSGKCLDDSGVDRQRRHPPGQRQVPRHHRRRRHRRRHPGRHLGLQRRR